MLATFKTEEDVTLAFEKNNMIEQLVRNYNSPPSQLSSSTTTNNRNINRNTATTTTTTSTTSHNNNDNSKSNDKKPPHQHLFLLRFDWLTNHMIEVNRDHLNIH